MTLDFNIIELPNFQANLEELRKYYQILKKHYWHRRWPQHFEEKSYAGIKKEVYDRLESVGYQVRGLYSWNLMTIYVESDEPPVPFDLKGTGYCHPDTPLLEGYTRPTDLMFGWPKHLLSQMPWAHQAMITIHPPGTTLAWHMDRKEGQLTDFVRIHIPLYSNLDSWFNFRDQNYCLEAGKAYLINTNREHMTTNQGQEERVHFLFNIPFDKIDQILEFSAPAYLPS
jgi:hypothetical protein